MYIDKNPLIFISLDIEFHKWVLELSVLYCLGIFFKRYENIYQNTKIVFKMLFRIWTISSIYQISILSLKALFLLFCIPIL